MPPAAQIRVKHMYILKNYIWVHRTPPTSRKIYCAQLESFLGWIRSNLSLVLLVNNEKSLTRFVGLSLPENGFLKTLLKLLRYYLVLIILGITNTQSAGKAL
jgi:hypothetical protein